MHLGKVFIASQGGAEKHDQGNGGTTRQSRYERKRVVAKHFEAIHYAMAIHGVHIVFPCG